MNKFSGILILLVGITGILACDMDKLMNIMDCVPSEVTNFDPDTGNVDDFCKAMHDAKECFETALDGCEGDLMDQAKASIDQTMEPLKEYCPKKDDDDDDSGSAALRMALLPVLAFALFAKFFVH